MIFHSSDLVLITFWGHSSGEHSDLVCDYALVTFALYRIYASELQVIVSTYDKIAVFQIDRIESGKIVIPSVEDIVASMFYAEKIYPTLVVNRSWRHDNK